MYLLHSFDLLVVVVATEKLGVPQVQELNEVLIPNQSFRKMGKSYIECFLLVVCFSLLILC
jgi:hypothetical protein